MKKHSGRKRRIGGWVLLALAVLVAGVWAASGWWWFAYQWGNGRLLGASNGLAVWGRLPMQPGWSGGSIDGAPAVSWGATRAPYMEEPYWNAMLVDYGRVGSGFRLSFSLWPLPLLLTVAGVPLLRSGVMTRRRAKAGSCPACGYDKRGIPEGAPCPECGRL